MDPPAAPDPSDAEPADFRDAAALKTEIRLQAKVIANLEAKRELARAHWGVAAVTIDRLQRGPPVGLEPPALDADVRSGWESGSHVAHRRAQARAAAFDQQTDTPSQAAGDQPEGGLARSWPPLEPQMGAGWAPLRVAEVGQGASCFADLGDPRIMVRPLDGFDASEVEVLVFGRANRDNVSELAAAVPEAVWTARRTRPLKVVFDASMEGFVHVPERSLTLLGLLASKGVDPADGIYLTQDRGYRAEHEAFCAARGLRPMQVRVHDRYMGRALAPFETAGPGAFADRLADFLRRPARRSRRFVSLNRTPRPMKMLYLSRLLRDGLWDQGWISFGGLAPKGGQAHRTRQAMADAMLAMPDFADEAADAVGRLAELDTRGAGLFGIDEARSPSRQLEQPIAADHLPQYGDAWLTVITETEMSDRVHRITEKALKPLLSFHPFLMFGSPGSLGLIRSYGFETFAGVLDESYDEEPDRRRRFDMVYGQLQRLCRAPEDELARMTASLQEVLAFNACWGLTELPRLFRRRIGARLVDSLLSTRAAIAGN